ncbi:MAG TPA: hypothetical protein VEQ10_12305 [Vicinamibacteria bacterium]|nr:hypothetical protein [Vicinamibacteria bacterium]
MSHRVAVRRSLVLLLLAAIALLPRPASAAEITAFISGASAPNGQDIWSGGWGGMLTISLLSVIHLEIEGAHQGGSSTQADTSMLTIAGKAYFGPPIGRFVPYVGLGGGAYRESLPTSSDDGTLGLVFAGAKLKFPFGLVIRGEYQWINLPSGVLLGMDHRYFAGVGLSF